MVVFGFFERKLSQIIHIVKTEMSCLQTERVPITKYIQAETDNLLSENKN